jgi:hypothetical protein
VPPHAKPIFDEPDDVCGYGKFEDGSFSIHCAIRYRHGIRSTNVKAHYKTLRIDKLETGLICGTARSLCIRASCGGASHAETEYDRNRWGGV